MITAEVTDQGIYLDATVGAANAGPPDAPTATIRFLVATGSPITVIQPKDAHLLAPVFPDLEQAPALPYTALPHYGGQITLRPAGATLAFQLTDSEQPPSVWECEATLYVAEPTEQNAELPSVLGMDVLSQWHWRLELYRGVAEFTPA